MSLNPLFPKNNPHTINVDWLSIWCTNNSSEIVCSDANVQLRKLPIKTKHFKEVHELYSYGRRIATIASSPSSSIFQANKVMLKLDNWLIYQPNVRSIVETIISNLNLTFNHISRIDVAMDFQKFANGLNPQKLISHFKDGKYIKKGHGTYSENGKYGKNVSNNYLRFGSSDSPFSYYLYNKSLEMKEVKEKPHIREKWTKNKFNNNLTCWRLEFSIKQSTKAFISKSTGEFIDMNTLDILNPQAYQDLFRYLVNTFFVFYKSNGLKRKSDNRKLNLFCSNFSDMQLDRITDKLESDRVDKMLINKLNQFYQDMRELNSPEADAANLVMCKMITSRNLGEWASKKGIVL